MAYSEKQIEIENILNSVGNGKVIPPEVIAEIVEMVENPVKRMTQNLPNITDFESDIRIKLLEEKDWRKRASLAALLISRSLE